MRLDELDIALEQGGIVKIYFPALFLPQVGELFFDGVFHLRHIFDFAGEQILAPLKVISLAYFAFCRLQRFLNYVNVLLWIHISPQYTKVLHHFKAGATILLGYGLKKNFVLNSVLGERQTIRLVSGSFLANASEFATPHPPNSFCP
jgi:hypothetical protein